MEVVQARQCPAIQHHVGHGVHAPQDQQHAPCLHAGGGRGGGRGPVRLRQREVAGESPGLRQDPGVDLLAEPARGGQVVGSGLQLEPGIWGLE